MQIELGPEEKLNQCAEHWNVDQQMEDAELVRCSHSVSHPSKV